MAKYIVTFIGDIEVEAEDEDAAIEMALGERCLEIFITDVEVIEVEE